MATTTTTPRTSYGSLRGVAEDGLVIVRGIPYARPAVGHLRFAPPQLPDSWTGTRDATIFGPRGISLQEFYRGLQPTMLPQLVGGLDQQVAGFDFGLELLIAGVDDDGGHLFQVGNPGSAVIDFAPIGFGAIGSGGLHAIQAMIGFAHAPARSLNDTIYRVFAAKRRAEVAPGVGHDTDLLVITEKGIQQLTSGAIETLQRIYDGYNRPVQAELDSQVRGAKLLEDAP